MHSLRNETIGTQRIYTTGCTVLYNIYIILSDYVAYGASRHPLLFQVRETSNQSTSQPVNMSTSQPVNQSTSQPAALMAQWLWEKKNQSAQLLFIVPGQKEVWDMCRALRTYSFNFEFVLGSLYGDSPKEASAKWQGMLKRQCFFSPAQDNSGTFWYANASV